jgi:predicted amidohydrolase YtcJ
MELSLKGGRILKSRNLALVNGKIITIDNHDSIQEAILISGEKIIAVGSNNEIKELVSKDCEVIDLEGRSVIPGFTDSHNHIELAINQLNSLMSVHTPPFESLEQIFNALEEKTKSTPEGEWIIARGSFGMHQKVREGRFPDRHDLDKVSTVHPIAIFSGMHITILNTKAFEVMGWNHETDMPRGSTFGRNSATGDITGVVTEVKEHLPISTWTYEQLMSHLPSKTIQYFVSRGVTSVHEQPFTTEGIHAWQELRDKDELPIRLRLYLRHPYLINLDEFIRFGLKKGFGDHWLSIGGIKLFADGANYHANLHPAADLKWTQEELDELVYKAHAAGLQILTHSLTHQGTKMAITSYERALARLPKSDHRHRVEHIGDRYEQFDETLLDRMNNSQIVPVTTPHFIYSNFKNKEIRLRTLINNGFILPGNTDSTGSQPESIDPWHSIWCCVQRKNMYGEIIKPEERLTPLEALRMFTLWGAWGGFEEKIKGSIETGKLADLVVMNLDPLTVDPDALRTMSIEFVMVGGEVKWSNGNLL